LTNGTSSTPVSVTYVVNGPTPTGQAIASGQAGSTNCATAQFICATIRGSDSIQVVNSEQRFGYYLSDGGAGMEFQIASSDPENSLTNNISAYQWVQLLTPRVDTYRTITNNLVCTQTSGLDFTYPYPNGSGLDQVGS
jgi:hypothetical protein